MWVIDNQQYLGQLDGWNRAAQFADGLFETMVVQNGVILGLSHHLDRLVHGLSRLHIELKSSELSDMFESYAHTFSDLSHHQNGVLKVIISRGDSQRGYGFDHDITPHITAFYNELPNYDASIYQVGVTVQSLSTQCAIQPQLAGLKHLNRLENVLAKHELGQQAFEGLMQNHLGFVIEGTMSNVFFEHEGALVTPDLSLSGVAGVMRGCIKKAATKLDMVVSEKDIPMSEISMFSHGFICNSVMGIVPIKQLNKKELNIGELTQKLIDIRESGEIYA